MFQAAEGVIDRIEQSFGIWMKSFIVISLPFFLFQIVMVGLIPEILKFLGANIALDLNFANGMNALYSSEISILVLGAILYILSYLFLLIPVTYATFLTISQVIQNEIPSPKNNLSQGFSYLGKLFQVYWYIFLYVYMIAALCFIVGGFMMIAGSFSHIEIIQSAGGIAMLLSLIYGVFQAIYRGLKSSFALPSAIFNNNFSRENFEHSINITDGKWWRILGNFLLVGIIGGLLIGLISGVLHSFTIFHTISQIDVADLLIQSSQNQDMNALKDQIQAYFSVDIFSIIFKLIEQSFNILLSIFLFIFTLVFYLRLRDEDVGTRKPNDSLDSLPVLEEL